MRPLTWYEKLWDGVIFNLFWRWAQCCAELPFKECIGVAYCVRPKWHPGRHRTNDGEQFAK